MTEKISALHPKETTGEIMQLFDRYGSEDYDGEPVSQTSHMIQCAMQAIDESKDSDTVIGAFLHDIGHLLKHEQTTQAMGKYGVVNHEGLGADYLRERGFSDKVCAVVEMHVQAKRYLVATDPTYKGKLSEASLETLRWQGGPMSEEEVKNFEQNPYFKDAIKVRLYDEGAKSRDTALLPLHFFENLIYEHLQNRMN